MPEERAHHSCSMTFTMLVIFSLPCPSLMLQRKYTLLFNTSILGPMFRQGGPNIENSSTALQLPCNLIPCCRPRCFRGKEFLPTPRIICHSLSPSASCTTIGTRPPNPMPRSTMGTIPSICALPGQLPGTTKFQGLTLTPMLLSLRRHVCHPLKLSSLLPDCVTLAVFMLPLRITCLR